MYILTKTYSIVYGIIFTHDENFSGLHDISINSNTSALVLNVRWHKSQRGSRLEPSLSVQNVVSTLFRKPYNYHVPDYAQLPPGVLKKLQEFFDFLGYVLLQSISYHYTKFEPDWFSHYMVRWSNFHICNII